MIEVQGLSKRYPTRLAVDDVTFSVKQGEIVGFLGPNGAGKTTTMRVLTGFLPPTSGSARVAGHDIVADSARRAPRSGTCPSPRPPISRCGSASTCRSARASKAFRARPCAGGSPRRSTSACSAEVAGRRIESLSKGFRQRTALAGALVHQPPVLVLDEPTIGLDPVQIIKIRETIRQLGRDRAVLLSTHILPEVESVCDRVLIIDRGRIVAEGTPAELRAKLAGTPTLRAAWKGSVAVRDGLAKLPGVSAVEVEESAGETRARILCQPGADPRDDVFRLAVENGWILRELSREALTLEDVFVRLTRHDEAEAAPAGAGEAS